MKECYWNNYAWRRRIWNRVVGNAETNLLIDRKLVVSFRILSKWYVWVYLFYRAKINFISFGQNPFAAIAKNNLQYYPGFFFFFFFFFKQVNFHLHIVGKHLGGPSRTFNNCFCPFLGSKVMLKILQARLQQYVNRELPDV